MPYITRMYRKTAFIPNLTDILPHVTSLTCMQLPAQIISKINLYINSTQPDSDLSTNSNQIEKKLT